MEEKNKNIIIFKMECFEVKVGIMYIEASAFLFTTSRLSISGGHVADGAYRIKSKLSL